MIKKYDKYDKDVIDIDNNDEDTAENLSYTLKNLFDSSSVEDKFSRKDITLIKEDKNIGNLRDFFNYENNKIVKKNLRKFLFLRKEKNKELNDEEVIKLFYQVLALVSEKILSYFLIIIIKFLYFKLVNSSSKFLKGKRHVLFCISSFPDII